jgi:hypothetical protein
MTTKRKLPQVAMDDPDPPPTPTKKLKLEQDSTSTEVAMDDTRAASPSMVVRPDNMTAVDSSASVDRPQHGFLETPKSIDTLDKEAAYGITEFVSPDLLGFTGFLKKRYAVWVLWV